MDRALTPPCRPVFRRRRCNRRRHLLYRGFITNHDMERDAWIGSEISITSHSELILIHIVLRKHQWFPGDYDVLLSKFKLAKVPRFKRIPFAELNGSLCQTHRKMPGDIRFSRRVPQREFLNHAV